MKVQYIDLCSIIIQDRARQDFDENIIKDMMESFTDLDVGLLKPIIVTSHEGALHLIAGETRTRAAKLLNTLGRPLYFYNETIPAGQIPAFITSKESPLSELKKERAENFHRALTWKEQVLLEKRILSLDQPDELITPSVGEINKTLEVLGQSTTRYHRQHLRQSIHLADALDTPTLEGKFKLCQTRTDANRVLKRLQREAEDNLLAKQLGESFYIDKHQILLGDCRELLTKLEADSYDLCITDPPYGINAHKFGISGGTMAGFQHNYDDSPEYWAELMPEVLEQLSRVMKPESHLYIACDICKFETLKEILKQVKSKVWQIQRTPLIEVKSFGRVAVIDFYYRRLYECWLYARTGSKNSKAILDDVISKNKAPLEGHHAAVKGEKAYRTFLQTSGEVGGTFIDPFAGSGSILPFIHEWGMTYLGIENDETTYGQCCKQLQLLQEN